MLAVVTSVLSFVVWSMGSLFLTSVVMLSHGVGEAAVNALIIVVYFLLRVILAGIIILIIYLIAQAL